MVVLTDNGIQFADLPKNRWTAYGQMAWTSLRSHLVRVAAGPDGELRRGQPLSGRALPGRSQPALCAASRFADGLSPTAQQLDEVFCPGEEERVVSADWVVSYKTRLLQLERQSRHYARARQRVTVRGTSGRAAIAYRTGHCAPPRSPAGPSGPSRRTRACPG